MKELEANYKDALIEINAKLEVLMARQDADMAHVIYQIEHQKALKTQVKSILENLQNNEFESISEYLANSYTDGFVGTMYDLHYQGIPLIVPIDQKQVIEAIQHETKLTSKLYDELGLDIKELQKNIAGEISRGIASGQGYPEIARNIANYAKIPKNRAMTIARTESHRIQCKATSDAQFKAKEKGADIVRQWDSSLDSKTRASHKRVDGEIRELGEKFSNGLMFPGDPSGKAEEVINCRCALLQRARWMLNEAELEKLKKRAEYFELDKTKDFEDYKKKYLKASEQEQVRSNAQKMKDESASQGKAQKKEFVPAKNVSEAQDRIKQASGGAKVDLNNMDVRVANDYLQGIEEFYSEYPELKGYIDIIDTKRSNIGAAGQFEVTWNMDKATFRPKAEVHFANQSYDDYKANIIENIESGYKFAGSNGTTTAKHELTHALQSKMYYMEKGLYADGQFTEQNIFSFKESKYSFASDSNKIVNKAAKQVYGKDYNSDKIKYLGDYAKQNRDELVAQAISYEMSGNTHPFSAEVKHIFDEKYEKTFGAKPSSILENTGKSGIIKVDKDMSKYIGKEIVKTDNQSIREWYYANVHDIPNQIDRSKPFEEQVKQAYNLRNDYKHEARVAMSDRETAERLEKKKPVKSFDELLQDKMNRKGLSKEEALQDILETASKTNANVDNEFGL